MTYKSLSSVDPYYDDFDDTKNYLRILFNPGRSVQARELTQLQTILHDQMGKFASHIFNDGSRVVGAKINVDLKKVIISVDQYETYTDYLDPNLAGYDTFSGNEVLVSNWQDTTLVGITSGAQAIVDDFEYDETNNTYRYIYISYQGGEFIEGEQIRATTSGGTQYYGRIHHSDVDGLVGIGQSVHAFIEPGIIYMNNTFVAVGTDNNLKKVVVDNNDTGGSYKIGFNVVESIATSAEDTTLVDPATGAYNFNAPGADRYKIDVALQSYESADYATIPETFIDIIEYKSGVLIKAQKINDYNTIMDLLAKRTFDTSGNYEVKEFKVNVNDHPSDETKLQLQIDSGSSYVQGYEVETIASTYIDINKSRTTAAITNTQSYNQYAPYTIVELSTDIHGMFDFYNREVVELLTTNDGTLGAEDEVVGEARIVAITKFGSEFKVFLSDLGTNVSRFSSVKSIRSKDTPATYVKLKIISGGYDWSAVLRSYSSSKTFSSLYESLIGRRQSVMDKPILVIPDRPEPIFTFFNNKIESIDNNSVTYNMLYQYTNITVSNPAAVLVNSTQTTIDFDSSEPFVYVIDNTTGEYISATVNTGASQLVTDEATTSVLAIDIGGSAATAIDVLVVFKRPKAAPRSKTLTDTNLSPAFEQAVSGVIIFNKVDIFNLVQVIQYDDDVGTNPVDVTSSATLDDGQRDFFYDYGSISGLDNTKWYKYRYVYFEHSTGSIDTGDEYFSVNSYINATNTTMYPDMYGRIPTYTGNSGNSYNLADVFDFRRSITDIETGSGYYIISPDEEILASYDYYLSRKDKMYVDRHGKFAVIEGVSSLNPTNPVSNVDGMILASITYSPYTKNKNNVSLTKMKHKTYTNADISRIDNRLSMLEYYSALSLLESSAKNIKIIDSNGMDKYKNGIFVDSFVDHKTSDVTNPLYRMCIDEKSSLGRPTVKIGDVDMEIDAINTSASIRTNTNTYTLDYTTSDYISQSSLNPNSVVINENSSTNFRGTIKLVPDSDNFIDVSVVPELYEDVDINNETDYIKNSQDYYASNYGWWENGWTGIDEAKVSDGISNPDNNLFSDTINQITEQRSVLDNVSTKNPSTSEKVVGGRIIEEKVGHFIRPQDIAYQIDGLKPNSSLVFTFDDIDVTASCTNTSSNVYGVCAGTFSIASELFRAGERIFRAAGSSVTGEPTSAETSFTVNGTVINNTGNVISLGYTNKISSSTDKIGVIGEPSNVASSSEPTWTRPIGQSFVVDKEGGMFVTSLALYFKTKPDDVNDKLPVNIMITEMKNGVPSINVVPYSEVSIVPASVNVNDSSPVTQTICTFSDPIYLMDKTEYAFVVMSNSDNYELWTTTSKDGNVGVMFTAQNTLSWSPDENNSVKFDMQIATFVAGSHDLVFTNGTSQDIDINSFVPSIDYLNFSDTVLEMDYTFFGENTTQLTNKESVITNIEKNIAAINDFKVSMTVTGNAYGNVSPVISKHRNSVFYIRNELHDAAHGYDPVDNIGGIDYYDFGSYITKPTLLKTPSDDIKVILDSYKPAGSELLVSFKTSSYTPKYVNVTGTTYETFASDFIYVYSWEGTGDVATMVAEAYVSKVDTTNDNYYLKSISDVSKFVGPAGWAGRGYDKLFFATADDIDTIVDEGVSWSATSYAFGDFVWYNAELWECANDLGSALEPTDLGTDWTKIETSIVNSVVQEDPVVDWRPMTLDDSADINAEGFVEYSYIPEEELNEEFNSFQVKVQLIASSSNIIPKIKNFRALALY